MSKNLMTLSQLFNHAFLAPKGYVTMDSEICNPIMDKAFTTRIFAIANVLLRVLRSKTSKLVLLANLIPLRSTLLLVLDFIES